MVESTSDDPGCWASWHADQTPLRLGASACLLGDEVRFDGGHARDRFVTDTLGNWFEWVKVCPEAEVGMGTPRPAIRLVEQDGRERLIAPSTGEDFTDRMNAYTRARVDELRELDLDGFVLKKSSPSCGLERIRVYREDGHVLRKNESGLFARELSTRWPALPVEEEGRLNDARLRENFIERVFARNRWRTLVARGLTRRRLIEFHTAHKLLLLAHNEAAYRRLGKWVGSAGERPDEQLFGGYECGFQEALRTKATPRRHANVLYHALGYLKQQLSAGPKRELITAVEDYRQGLLPLVVPLSLLRYEIRHHGVDYLAGQLYFDPHPKELMLRNHV
jgi:uncharacterized protein YbgA (DUF1722 family)/uncharacterized protein YbbK (DUF523 family)